MSYTIKKYVADTMLGKLAKWLRVMGYDTHYQSIYSEQEIEKLIQEGRLLLSRKKSQIDKYQQSFFISSEKINEQLIELKAKGLINRPGPKWFSRCLICNEELISIPVNQASDKIPEYIYYQNIERIRNCIKCNRYYWPGSHRRRMLDQLYRWKIICDPSPFLNKSDKDVV